MKIFEGSVHDIPLLTSCICDCRAILLVVSTNNKIPSLGVGQDTAAIIIRVFKQLQSEESDQRMPKLLLLSSATTDDQLSHDTPALLRRVLLMSASHVHHDLQRIE